MSDAPAVGGTGDQQLNMIVLTPAMEKLLTRALCWDAVKNPGDVAELYEFAAQAGLTGVVTFIDTMMTRWMREEQQRTAERLSKPQSPRVARVKSDQNSL